MRKRWTYSSPLGLTQGYGQVGYYGEYVVSHLFALDANSGKEYWSRKNAFGHEFRRVNAVSGVSRDIIVATEMRSDGPWTWNFGIYGFEARTGRLIWTSHAQGIYGKLLRCLDAVPGFTNEFRDAPVRVHVDHVLTQKKRVLDIRTGLDISGANSADWPLLDKALAYNIYAGNSTKIKSGELRYHQSCTEKYKLEFLRADGVAWTFVPSDMGLFLDGTYYSGRLHRDHLLILLGDAPSYLVRQDTTNQVVKNAAVFQLCVIEVENGRRAFYIVGDGKPCLTCRIETVLGNRVLVSQDDKLLIEYELDELS